MAIDLSKPMAAANKASPANHVGQATQCTDIHPDSDCVNSSSSRPVPKVKRIVDVKNEPAVKPGEMLEDEKFTQH